MEYRQKVPAGESADFDSQIERDVRAALSICASPTDDPDRFRDAVVITRRPSRTGGHWIHGELDAAPTPMPEVPEDEWRSDIGHSATVAEPVDLDADAYAAHLEQKRSR